MRVFDLLFLLMVSGFVATRSPFSGVVVLVLGLLIRIQLFRMRLLLGGGSKSLPAGRRVRALALSLALSVTLFPLVQESSGPGPTEIEYSPLLPVVILISLLSAAMMAGLAVEKRKR
jgi:hypothetical protein